MSIKQIPVKYKGRTLTSIAKDEYGCDLRTFWGILTPQHRKTMIDLGWLCEKNVLTPPVAEYVVRHVINREPYPFHDFKE